MVMILAAATGTVFFKLYVIDEPPNPNISTFRPLPQQVKNILETSHAMCIFFYLTSEQVNDGIMYNGIG